MKLFIFFVLFSTQSLAQTITVKQAQKLSKEIAGCIKKNSIFSDSLNLEGIEKDFEQYIDTFNTYQEVGYYYTRQLHKAGDKHSFYVHKSTLENFSQKQKERIGFSYQLLEGNIGYLSIPGFLSTDNNVINDFANQIHNAIRKLDSIVNINGWIVDLRNNEGGNMWPMVLGLNPLIGNEVPGYFKNTGQKNAAEWKTSSPFNGVTIKEPYQLKNPKSKIAVLYSKRTASSGETTAICFIGKPNTKSFGEVTAGLTTGNHIFNLSDDNIFILATSYIMDRNKKMYSGSITPDVLIEKPDNDNVIEEAKVWLKE
jgi:hypothetical protein